MSPEAWRMIAQDFYDIALELDTWPVETVERLADTVARLARRVARIAEIHAEQEAVS